MKYENRTTLFTTILLCGVAIHYMFITIILNDNILFKFWKEILIVIMLFDIFILKFNNRYESRLMIDYSSIVIFFFLACLFISSLITNNISKCIYVIRLYCIPLLIYYIGKNNASFTKKSVSKIIKYIIVFYCIICIWGIFQALVLGDKFLINLGYPLKYEGRLRDSYYFGGFGNFQRVMSTFSNTNVFGAILGMLIIISIFNISVFSKRRNGKIAIAIFSITLLLTFSRSNWIALSIILLMISRKNPKLLKSIFISFCIIGLFIFIYGILSDVNIFEILKQYLYNTVTLKEDSAVGRFGIWREAFNIFIYNPLGIGFGNVGTVSLVLNGRIIIPGESSYLAILLDTGIQGAICFFSTILYNYIAIYKTKLQNKDANNFLRTVRYIILYILIMFIFSNHIYDLEITVFTFFFIGLARNKNFIQSFIK